MIDGCEYCKLHADNEDATSDRNEDLGHDEITDVSSRLAKVDHQALGEDVKRKTDPQKPLEVSGFTDTPANKEQEETRNNAEGVVDITGLGNGKVVDNLQEGGKVAVPAVVRNLISHIQEACANNSSVGQEVELQERHWGKKELIQGEGDQQDESNDKHGNNVARTPAMGGRTSDVEREKEDDQASGKQENTEGYRYDH
jgi:hypothetical protein